MMMREVLSDSHWGSFSACLSPFLKLIDLPALMSCPASHHWRELMCHRRSSPCVVLVPPPERHQDKFQLVRREAWMRYAPMLEPIASKFDAGRCVRAHHPIRSCPAMVSTAASFCCDVCTACSTRCRRAARVCVSRSSSSTWSHCSRRRRPWPNSGPACTNSLASVRVLIVWLLCTAALLNDGRPSQCRQDGAHPLHAHGRC